VALVAPAAIPVQPTPPAAGYAKAEHARIPELLFGVWERADTLWYIHIAKDGYDPRTDDAAFLPLYPMLIRAAHFVMPFLPWIYPALLISNLAFFFALICLYRLAELELGQAAAERALWYQVFFPGSCFLFAAYTEPLFLALAAAAFLFARRGEWARAGVAAGFLALSRNLGVLIVLPLAREFWRTRPRGRDWLRLGWLALAPAALGCVMLFWDGRAGDALAFVHRQAGWQRARQWPWVTLWEGFAQGWNYASAYPGGVYILEAWGMALAVALGVVAWARIAASQALFLWLGLLPALWAPFPGRMFMSSLRFVSVLFPVFFTLAAVVRKPETDAAIRVLFVGLYALTLALFISGQYMF
jgi:hypothetical protein